MDYHFGPNKPEFNGTKKEWNELQEEIAWWNEDTSTYPILKVICPHCGALNIHEHNPLQGARYECQLMIDNNGKQIFYKCPGFVICRWINTPR